MKWVNKIFGVIGDILHAIANTLIWALQWTFIAAIFGLVALVVIQYTYGLHYDVSPGYKYQSYIEGKVGVLQGKTKALLVRFDVVDLDQAAFMQTRAFLTPKQVLQLEELPTLVFTKTAPGCYHIEELQVTTKRI